MSFVDSLLGHPRSYYDLKLLSDSTSDVMPFSSQLDDVEKAIENLGKSGKLFLCRGSLPSMTRPYHDYDYRSCLLASRQSSTYELEHMRSRFAMNASSCYTNQHYYNQRAIGQTEHFPLSRRRNKSNSEPSVYAALDQRSGVEHPHFFRCERVKGSSPNDVIPNTDDGDVIYSGFPAASRALPNYIYDELGLNNYSASALSLQQETSACQYPFTYYHEYSTKVNNSVENRVVSDVIGVGNVNKNLSFFYKKKKNSIMDNDDVLSSLVPNNKMKNTIAPIGTKSSNSSLSVESLNQQILDATVAAKPLHYYLSEDGDLKNDLDNDTLLRKYMVSGMSMHLSLNDRIWGDDVKNLGISSNSNGVGLDVLC